jgi:carboxymethylenebutenolidase
MTSEDRNQDRGGALLEDPSRREFVAVTAAVGLAAGVGSAGAAESGRLHVQEKEVQIMTGDGMCNAAYASPSTGKHPGVIVWTDIFGLRPTFRTLARRLAASGYSVLVPNPFYRSVQGDAYTEDQIAKADFRDPNARAAMMKNTGPINMAGAIETDAKAHVAFLTSQAEVDTNKKMGTVGFCMGGPLVFRTAASQADQIGAGVTFHGGGLVTDRPDSPHLLIPMLQAQMYLAIAASDDKTQPDAKDKLKAAFAAASVPKVQKSSVVVYAGTFHGWTVPDMPKQADGSATYNKAEADRAWSHMLSTYRANLA